MYGKSASAGGASMTPSSVACVCAVIEVIRVRPPAGAQLIATHETGAPGATSRAVEHAVLEVPVAGGCRFGRPMKVKGRGRRFFGHERRAGRCRGLGDRPLSWAWSR